MAAGSSARTEDASITGSAIAARCETMGTPTFICVDAGRRAPSLLSDPIARGWASSRQVRTFEDAVIFVLDVEKCLDRLGPLDRALLSRIVLQEHTQVETAALLGMSARAVSYKLPLALDRLTEKLLELGMLVLPLE